MFDEKAVKAAVKHGACGSTEHVGVVQIQGDGGGSSRCTEPKLKKLGTWTTLRVKLFIDKSKK
jgi:hypothetical protein